MKSQMELALTIGTVVVGAVLLISALVLSWEIMLPATDSCRIAAGIGYDIMSLQSSLFTVPGTITVFYTPPNICEFKSQMNLPGIGLVCQPLQGGNPNITGISVEYVKIDKTYGLSSYGPAYLLTTISFNWINNNQHNKVESTSIGLKGIATSSPGLVNEYSYLTASQSNINIQKIQTPYGDVMSPMTASSEDAIEKIATSMIASAYNSKKYSSGEIKLPATWFLTYNSTSKQMCEYRIIFNSYLYYYINYYADLPTRNDFVDKFGFGYSDTCDSNYLYINRSISYTPNAPVDCFYKKYSSTIAYNPWDSSNVEKYGTGFLKIRCFNLAKITKDPKITSISVSLDNSQKINNDFNSTYRDVNYDMLYEYNATYDSGKVNLELWKK